jgi:hypothetical protein
MALLRTDVSEESIVSINRVIKIGELGTRLVTSKPKHAAKKFYVSHRRENLKSYDVMCVSCKLRTSCTYKNEAIPVTDHGGLYGCEMLRILHCVNNRLTDGGGVLILTQRQRSTLPNTFSFLPLVLVSVRYRVNTVAQWRLQMFPSEVQKKPAINSHADQSSPNNLWQNESKTVTAFTHLITINMHI